MEELFELFGVGVPTVAAGAKKPGRTGKAPVVGYEQQSDDDETLDSKDYWGDEVDLKKLKPGSLKYKKAVGKLQRKEEEAKKKMALLERDNKAVKILLGITERVESAKDDSDLKFFEQSKTAEFVSSVLYDLDSLEFSSRLGFVAGFIPFLKAISSRKALKEVLFSKQVVKEIQSIKERLLLAKEEVEGKAALSELDRLIADISFVELNLKSTGSVSSDFKYGDKVSSDMLPEIPPSFLEMKYDSDAKVAAEYLKNEKVVFTDLTEWKSFFEGDYLAGSSKTVNKKRLGRIRNDIKILKDSLPDGIHVCVNEDRYDKMIILITGPLGTPYEYGCFFFDLYLPPEYPEVPPKMNLINHNGFRFNPNLYEDGYVCFSLLGTWEGPGWNPTSSTLLQLLVSLQAMVLCEHPYCNEPGYENKEKTQAAKLYSERIRLGKYWFAIYNLLAEKKHIPPGFEKIVTAYYITQRSDLLVLINTPIDESSMEISKLITESKFDVAKINELRKLGKFREVVLKSKELKLTYDEEELLMECCSNGYFEQFPIGTTKSQAFKILDEFLDQQQRDLNWELIDKVLEIPDPTARNVVFEKLRPSLTFEEVGYIERELVLLERETPGYLEKLCDMLEIAAKEDLKKDYDAKKLTLSIQDIVAFERLFATDGQKFVKALNQMKKHVSMDLDSTSFRISKGDATLDLDYYSGKKMKPTSTKEVDVKPIASFENSGENPDEEDLDFAGDLGEEEEEFEPENCDVDNIEDKLVEPTLDEENCDDYPEEDLEDDPENDYDEDADYDPYEVAIDHNSDNEDEEAGEMADGFEFPGSLETVISMIKDLLPLLKLVLEPDT